MEAKYVESEHDSPASGFLPTIADVMGYILGFFLIWLAYVLILQVRPYVLSFADAVGSELRARADSQPAEAPSIGHSVLRVMGAGSSEARGRRVEAIHRGVQQGLEAVSPKEVRAKVGSYVLDTREPAAAEQSPSGHESPLEEF